MRRNRNKYGTRNIDISHEKHLIKKYYYVFGSIALLFLLECSFLKMFMGNIAHDPTFFKVNGCYEKTVYLPDGRIHYIHGIRNNFVKISPYKRYLGNTCWANKDGQLYNFKPDFKKTNEYVPAITQYTKEYYDNFFVTFFIGFTEMIFVLTCWLFIPATIFAYAWLIITH